MKFSPTLRTLALGAALCIGAAGAHAEAVVNGDFSSGAASWNINGGLPLFSSGAVLLATMPWGEQSQIYQILDAGIDANTTYKLTFDAIGTGWVDLTSANYALCTGVGSGCNTNEITFTGSTHYTFYFTTAAADYTHLWFGSSNSGFVALDNVSVTAVPEPETYALMLAGLGAVGYMARRRKAG